MKDNIIHQLLARIIINWDRADAIHIKLHIPSNKNLKIATRQKPFLGYRKID